MEVKSSDARSKEQTETATSNEDAKLDDTSAEGAQDMDIIMIGSDSPKTLKESPPQDLSKPEQQQPPPPESPVQDQPPSDQPQAIAKPREHPLQLEIPSGDHQGSDNPTDAATGTYSNFDFESLFNDPSANPSPNVHAVESPPAKPTARDPTPVPEPTTTATLASTTEPEPTKQVAAEVINLDDGPDHPSDPNTGKSDTFDFGDMADFGNDAEMQDNDNDNISSLLPGLESYANAPDQSQQQHQQQTSNPPDNFNIFDAVGGPDFGAAAPAPRPVSMDNSNNAGQTMMMAKSAEQLNTGDQGILQEEARDDTFDALMNFDNFDMGSFGGEDDDGKGATAFDASFFDIS